MASSRLFGSSGSSGTYASNSNFILLQKVQGKQAVGDTLKISKHKIILIIITGRTSERVP